MPDTRPDLTYRMAVEGTLDAFYLLRAVRSGGEVVDFVVVDLNSRAEQEVGLGRDALIGVRLCEQYPAARAPQWFGVGKQVLESGEALERECHLDTPSLPHRTFRQVIMPVKNGIAVFSRDLTEQRSAEQAMMERAAMLQEAQEIARMVSFSVAPGTGTIREVQRLARFLSIADTDCVDWESLARRIHAEDRPVWRELRGARSGVSTAELDLRLVDDKGQPRVFHASYRAPDSRSHANCILREVTEDRRAESERLRLEHLLVRHQVSENVQSAAQRLAHDLNNCLMGVLANDDLARQCLNDPDELVTCLDGIRVSARAMSRMTRDMLSLLRQQSGAVFELGKVLQHAVAIARPLLPDGKALVVDLELLPPTCNVMGNALEFEQVITNLLVNAFDAIRYDGDTVRISAVGIVGVGGITDVQVVVEDDGVGMTPEVLSQCFRPFYTTKPDGTGLGLASARRAIRDHGGELGVTSSPGRGARFQLRVPLSSAPVAPGPPRPVRSSEVGLDGARVLVIDDELAVGAVIRRSLARFGADVSAWVDANEALRRFGEDPEAFDLALVDVVMPNISGPDVLARLKAIRPTLPVVLMSGFVPDERVLAPADAFQPKPFTGSELLGTVQGLLLTSPASDPPPSRLGPAAGAPAPARETDR